MYRDNNDGRFDRQRMGERSYDKGNDRNGEDVYSFPVKAGKRTYFFDVRSTKGNDYYLTITESKRKVEADGRFTYDKHKIFLYKEDFEKFTDGLQNVIDYVKKNCAFPIEERKPEERPEEGETYNSDVKFEEL